MSDRVVGRSPCIVMPSCSSRIRVDPERPTRSTRSGCGLSEQLVKIIWSRRAAAVGNPVETKKKGCNTRPLLHCSRTYRLEEVTNQARIPAKLLLRFYLCLLQDRSMSINHLTAAHGGRVAISGKCELLCSSVVVVPCRPSNANSFFGGAI